jgi:hypothetical protein
MALVTAVVARVDGKSFSYAEVQESVKAALFSARRCVPD